MIMKGMKRISFVLILVLPVFAMMAFAQEHRFSVGVNFMTPIGQNGVHDRGPYNWIYYDSQSNYNEYWEAGIEGTYTLPVYRCLEFQPSLSLSYARHHNFNLKTDGGSGYYVRGRLNQMNLDLCVPVSVRLKLAKSSVDIGTGPVLGTYLFQKQKIYNADDVARSEDNLTKRFRFYWRFYARYNFLQNRMFAKLAYDLGVSHYVRDADLRNQMVLGVGMNF